VKGSLAEWEKKEKKEEEENSKEQGQGEEEAPVKAAAQRKNPSTPCQFPGCVNDPNLHLRECACGGKYHHMCQIKWAQEALKLDVALDDNRCKACLKKEADALPKKGQTCQWLRSSSKKRVLWNSKLTLMEHLRLDGLELDVEPWDWLAVEDPDPANKHTVLGVVVAPAIVREIGTILFVWIPKRGVFVMESAVVVAAGRQPEGFHFTRSELHNILGLTIDILRKPLSDVEIHAPREPLTEPEEQEEEEEEDGRNPYLKLLKDLCTPLVLPDWGELCDRLRDFDYEVGDRVYRLDKDGNEVDAIIGAILKSGYLGLLPRRASRIQYWDADVIKGILA
jgi:hypothetical protein